jgi:hypothetical protein
MSSGELSRENTSGTIRIRETLDLVLRSRIENALEDEKTTLEMLDKANMLVESTQERLATQLQELVGREVVFTGTIMRDFAQLPEDGLEKVVEHVTEAKIFVTNVGTPRQGVPTEIHASGTSEGIDCLARIDTIHSVHTPTEPIRPEFTD